MKIAITGATSFIGTKLIKIICNTNNMCIAIVRKNKPKLNTILSPHNNLALVQLDMENYNELGEKIGPVDALIHLAWNGTRGAERSDTALQQKNLDCSVNAVNSVIKTGCSRIILVGSQAEYGINNEPIFESTPCIPNTEYGKSKLALYQYTSKLCKIKGIRCKEGRIFSLYGPNDFKNTLISQLVENMKSNLSCDLTLCTQKWDYLYIDDAARALLTLTQTECEDGPYNIGSGDCRPLKDYVFEIRDILGSQSKLRFGAIPYPSTGRVSIQPIITKILERTNWKPTTTFKEGILNIIKNPN